MRLYTNEIVFRGHPDKVCDQISDALLDAYLKEDKHSRCEDNCGCIMALCLDFWLIYVIIMK